MSTTFNIPQTTLPAGSNDLPIVQAPVSFIKMRMDINFASFPPNSTFSYSQFYSLDNQVTWIPNGSATLASGPNGLMDKNGNPTLHWPFEAESGTLLSDGTVVPIVIPAGAFVRAHTDCSQSLPIANGTLVLT